MARQFRPGVFDYAGFGMGHFYNADSTKTWCSNDEAAALAKQQGLPWKYIDTLDNSWGFCRDYEDYKIEVADRPLKTFRVKVEMLIDAVDEESLHRRLSKLKHDQLVEGATDIYFTVCDEVTRADL